MRATLFLPILPTHVPPAESPPIPAPAAGPPDTRLDDLLALAHHSSTLPRDLHNLARNVAQHYAEARTFQHEARNRLRRLVSASRIPATPAAAPPAAATLFIRTAPRASAFEPQPDTQMAYRGRRRGSRGRGFGRPVGGGRRREMGDNVENYDLY